ncbi:MAG: Rrf2 family transcriptional regulator [Chloroflexi bacterium]|nr:Rrf2 family transcriptional regulator [Chloroflexota bacterium]
MTVRLEITRKTELALRAVRALAYDDRTQKGDTLAVAIGTSPSFLAQALGALVRVGWLRSDPGPRGGYRLAPEARHLSVLDVIEAIEDPTVSGRCVLAADRCAEVANSYPCALHDAWSKARESLLEQLRLAPAIGPADAAAGSEGSGRPRPGATTPGTG